MQNSFICKIYSDEEFLGTAFLIKNNIAYSAEHCFEGIETYEDCYLEYNKKKYRISSVDRIVEIDFVEITLRNIVEEIKLPEISTECILNNEKLQCYGYREVDDEIVGTPMNISEYPLEFSEDEKADYGFIIDGEVDFARWNGISGGPIYDGNSVKGIVLMNYGNDGIKTRLKVISFNKIVNYLVDNNKNSVIENFPNKFVSSNLEKRLKDNKYKCNSLCYISNHKFECDDITMWTNFLKVNNGIDINRLYDELDRCMNSYALSLEEKYSEGNFVDDNQIEKIFKRVSEVKERMKKDDNNIYILLWMFTEGIIDLPRVARVFVKDDGVYKEEDIYLKREDSKIKLLIPIISNYDDIFESIANVIEKIRIKRKNNFLNLNCIEWDMKAINCLDIKTNVEVGKIVRGCYSKEIEIEITALALCKSEIYSNIPSMMNTEKRIESFFKTEFSGNFDDKEEYRSLIEKINIIDGIKVNLFILPISN